MLLVFMYLLCRSCDRACDHSPPSTILKFSSHFSGAHGIRVASLNVNSLPAKIDEIALLASCGRLDVLAIVESKLDLSFSDASLRIEGYDLFRRDRNRNGGGVALYVRSSHRATLVFSDPILELLAVRIKPINLIITVCYLPPGSSSSTTSDLRKQLCTYSGEKALFMGDFNLDVGCSDGRAHDFVKVLNTAGFVQLVKDPTRVTPNSSTTIDLLLCNCVDYVTKVSVAKLTVSDHYCVTGVIRTRIKKTVSECGSSDTDVVECRNLRGINPFEFADEISKTDFSNLRTEINNADEFAGAIARTVNCVMDKLAPRRRKRIRKKANPWFQSHIFSMIENRSFFHDRWFATRSLDDWNIYRFWRNKVRNEIKRCKKQYIHDKIRESAGNSTKWWQTVKSLGDFENTLDSDPNLAADQLNEYFLSVPEKFRSKLKSKCNNAGVGGSVQLANRCQLNEFNIPHLSTDECFKLVLSLKKTSAGPDEVEVECLKNAVHSLGFLHFLTDFFNMVVSDYGCVPQLA